MMKLQATHTGQVFTCPSDKVGVYYSVTSIEDDGIVATTVKAKSQQTTRRFTSAEMAELLPTQDEPFIEADLTPLVGKRLKVESVYGVNTGLCVGLLYREMTLVGEDVRVDFGVVLSGGEEYKISDMKSIEVVS